MTSIALIRGSTEVISRSISQRGKELHALDQLFSVAERVARLSPTQIKLHSQSLESMLATTKDEIKTLSTNLSKIDDDLGKVETPLSVGNNASRDRAHAETLSQLRELVPPIKAAGKNAALLMEKIKIVQRKIADDSVPTASCCASLISQQNAMRALYTLAAFTVSVISIGAYQMYGR